MQTYGVIIDKGMLLNLLHTDTREAFSYFNASLAIWLIFATILPCVYVALIEISYGGFKSALRSRVKIALCTLVSAAIIFALMSKILYHFLKSHNASSVLLPYYPIYSGIRLAKSLAQKPLPFTYVADDATLTNDKKKKF